MEYSRLSFAKKHLMDKLTHSEKKEELKGAMGNDRHRTSILNVGVNVLAQERQDWEKYQRSNKVRKAKSKNKRQKGK